MKRVKLFGRFGPVLGAFSVPSSRRLRSLIPGKGFGGFAMFILGCHDGSPDCICTCHNLPLAPVGRDQIIRKAHRIQIIQVSAATIFLSGPQLSGSGSASGQGKDAKSLLGHGLRLQIMSVELTGRHERAPVDDAHRLIADVNDPLLA